MARPSGVGGQPSRHAGADQHATIHMTVPESYSGTKRTLALRTVELDDEGHAHERVRELEVSIPKGVREGQMIRLAGKGQPGMGHGPAGDLLLEVKFADDRRWHAEGKDVYQQVHVTPWQAALGGPVEFHTLAGTFQISVPPGSQSGRKLRIRGKGLPAKEPGDLYLVLEITVPVPTTDAQREAYAALARHSATRRIERTAQHERQGLFRRLRPHRGAGATQPDHHPVRQCLQRE